jgi:hypothetical protein
MSAVIKVQVTQEDIDEGCRGDFACCPIARALWRVFPEKSVMVEFHCVWIGDMKRELPPDAVRFIEEYDTNHLVQPFEFSI